MTAVALHHEVAGPPDAPLVVLTGSLGTRLSMWDPQVRALSDRYRVVRCDVRGHGGSPVPPGPYTIAALGQDLVGVLDEVEAARVDLVGLSIGAMMSLWVAAHAPDRVRRLVACCTTARFGAEAAGAYVSRAAAVRAAGLEDLADGVVARWFTSGFATDRPDVVARFRTDLVATPREGYAACCEALAELDLTGDLGAIAAPTLVISGAEDEATPPSHGEAIAASVPGARFECLPGAAHLASVERAQAVNDLVATFLEEA